MTQNEYYVYLYLREDGTPYYVGKGKGNRAFSNNRRTYHRPEDESRIVFPAKSLTENEAFELEKELIAKYGRKNNNTGILRNLTDGGDGQSGRIPSQKSRDKMSISSKKFWCDLDRVKHSINVKIAMAKPEVKLKHSINTKTAMSKPEVKAKISNTLKEKYRSDPEYKLKMQAAQKKARITRNKSKKLQESANLTEFFISDPVSD